MIYRLFPFILLIATVLALIHPFLFTWFSGPLIPIGLGMIMIGMGMNLKMEDFRAVKESPISVVVGVVLQFSIMPSAGYIIASLLDLPVAYFAGLVLVASCPGGTASNVIVYLARGNLALSVVLTSISTFLAIGITPSLVGFIVGSRLEVNPWGLFFSTLQVVLIPIILGLTINRYFARVAKVGRSLSGYISVLFITLIVASIIGSGRDIILAGDGKIFAAVIGLHATGFLLGYGIVRWILKRGGEEARTISIEVGMQNSGLGAVLARSNFVAPETAIPSAISSLVHSLFGSFLAGIWRNSKENSVDPERGG
ncbi:MAG: bile acid:sodium symporter family protein [Leptospira sp.]|nr:bile acid:sodium symporter family protein [Leptospira sp.]